MDVLVGVQQGPLSEPQVTHPSRRDGIGSDGFFLGNGQQSLGRVSYRPTPTQVEQVVAALLQALESERNPDVVTGALIALAKIGAVRSEDGSSRLQAVIERFLDDESQEIRETAAVALGILAHPSTLPTLAHLVTDDEEGRRLVGSHEVDYRTRAFAAYGLGLIGHQRTTEPRHRARIVSLLEEVLESEDTSTRDLAISCIIAMGLVPIDVLESPSNGSAPDFTPASAAGSLSAQLEFLLEVLDDESRHHLVRAHCPTALARLLSAVPTEHRESWRKRIGAALAERLRRNTKERHREVLQSCALAAGLVGTNGDEGDELRKLLFELPEHTPDQQARRFALIAAAKAAGNSDPGTSHRGVEETARFLERQLTRGKAAMRPWAGLAIGVLGHRLARNGDGLGGGASLARAVRLSLEEERNTSRMSAYALGAGLLGDVEAIGILRDKLARVSDDEAQGYLAIALGLLNAREAVEEIHAIVAESQYRPARLKQAAIALGLLGDKHAVGTLVEMLAKSKSLATQAALAAALGFIGDRDAVGPLIRMLADEDASANARAFAAAALGVVAEREPHPWNSKIAADLNYRAATPTLVDATGSSGILDIL